MTAMDEQIPEFSDETLEVIRFLLKDNAFDGEFLITTIQEYCVNNSEECAALLKKKVEK
jgi:hypothetical protein